MTTNNKLTTSQPLFASETLENDTFMHCILVTIKKDQKKDNVLVLFFSFLSPKSNKKKYIETLGTINCYKFIKFSSENNEKNQIVKNMLQVAFMLWSWPGTVNMEEDDKRDQNVKLQHISDGRHLLLSPKLLLAGFYCFISVDVAVFGPFGKMCLFGISGMIILVIIFYVEQGGTDKRMFKNLKKFPSGQIKYQFFYQCHTSRF